MTFDRDALVTLCGIARDAGAIVKRIYETPFDHWQKGDASPVTEADLQADAAIRAALRAAFPGIGIVSEEAGVEVEEGANCFFLVDALDGTREFLGRNGEFTVNVALVRGGRTVAGAVYAPVLDELFYAAEGVGAFRDCGSDRRPLRVSGDDPQRCVRIIGSRSHRTASMDVWLASLARPYTFVPAGSSLKFCRIAEGCADVYPRFGPTNQWDTAAAQCVLEQAGGRVAALGGTPLVYGLDRPMLNPSFAAVGDPALLALLPSGSIPA